MEEKTAPVKKFTTGGITATIWLNPGVKEGTTYNTVSFQRTYKDKEGNWKSTSSLRTNDLPKAVMVLEKAYEHLILKDAS